jgi:hypothetical protein
VSDVPPPIPVLDQPSGGPDESTRRRLVTRMEGLIAYERATGDSAIDGRSRGWVRPLAAAALVAVLTAVLFVPLPHVSLFRRLVAPASPAPTTTLLPTTTTITTYPAGYQPLPIGAGAPISDLEAVSFANESDGAGVFEVHSPMVHPDTLGDTTFFQQIGITTDGGASWRIASGYLPATLHRPGFGGSISIVWSGSGGFVWDTWTVLQISDGGERWRDLGPPPGASSDQIDTAAVGGGTIWVGVVCPSGRCADPLWSWSPNSGWQRLPLGANVAVGWIADIVRLGASTGLVLTTAPTLGTVGKPTGELYETTDGGASWAAR